MEDKSKRVVYAQLSDKYFWPKISFFEIYCRYTFKSIRVAGNGFGMTAKDIVENWVRIGFSEKKDFKTSKKGRRKTDEKGIGRNASDRLGAKLTNSLNPQTLINFTTIGQAVGIRTYSRVTTNSTIDGSSCFAYSFAVFGILITTVLTSN